MPTATAMGRPALGSAIQKKSIYVYADGNFSIGRNFVKFPAICKHFGWKNSLCGPTIMAWDLATKEAHCPCSLHKQGCPEHEQPLVKGKAFALADHRDELSKLGLTSTPEELARTVAWLLSADARSITGQNLEQAGGWML